MNRPTPDPVRPPYRCPGKNAERPISAAHGVIDNDLARDNLENDLTAADEQDV